MGFFLTIQAAEVKDIAIKITSWYGKEKKKERKENLGNMLSALSEAQEINIFLKMRVLTSVKVLGERQRSCSLCNHLALSVYVFQGLFHAMACVLTMASWFVFFISDCLVM